MRRRKSKMMIAVVVVVVAMIWRRRMGNKISIMLSNPLLSQQWQRRGEVQSGFV